MAAQKAVTDEQLGRYARRTRTLQELLEKGVVPYEPSMDGLQSLIEGKFNQKQVLLTDEDPLAPFRHIKGLIFIGPHEWERKAMTGRGENRNPLGLVSGWCPQIPMPYTVEQATEVVKLCQTPEWATTPILRLVLPEVAGQPTSLVNQRNWWGIEHDVFKAGIIRTNIMWSGWFLGQNYAWADEPAVDKPTWIFGYELPHWTTHLDWDHQQEAARNRGMSIAAASRDALMCNLAAINSNTRRKLRTATWSRTVTIYGGYPLNVSWYLGLGLNVNRHCNPGSAYGPVGASVEGVPSELGF